MSPTSAATSRFDAALPAVPPARIPHLLRGNGVAEVVLGESAGKTGIVHLYQQTPCRVLFPSPPRKELLTAVLLTTSGGLTGGDQIRVTVLGQVNSQAVITSQAAEKIYRSKGAPTNVDSHIQAETGSWLEWIPQETILFDRCRLSRSTTITASPGAEIIAGDLMVFGRLAHGELFTQGTLRDTWKVLRDGRPVWLDRLILGETPGAPLDHAASLGGARAMATFIYVADHAIDHVETARALLDPCPIRCGVTCVNGVLITRFLAEDPHQLRLEFMRFWSAFRAAVKSLRPQVPRVWEC